LGVLKAKRKSFSNKRIAPDSNFGKLGAWQKLSLYSNLMIGTSGESMEYLV